MHITSILQAIVFLFLLSYLHDLFADDNDLVIAFLENLVQLSDAVLKALFQVSGCLLGVLQIGHLVSVYDNGLV